MAHIINFKFVCIFFIKFFANHSEVAAYDLSIQFDTIILLGTPFAVFCWQVRTHDKCTTQQMQTRMAKCWVCAGGKQT